MGQRSKSGVSRRSGVDVDDWVDQRPGDWRDRDLVGELTSTSWLGWFCCSVSQLLTFWREEKERTKQLYLMLCGCI